MNRYKKDLGEWGETLLDKYMQAQGWHPYEKNMRIKHGEIDRVYYCHNKEREALKFCVCEIKATVLYKKAPQQS